MEENKLVPVGIQIIMHAGDARELLTEALNANALRNYYYTDVYFKGRYDRASHIYLEKNGLAPRMEPGDEAVLKAGISDFLALNYYSSDAAAMPPRTQNGASLAE